MADKVDIQGGPADGLATAPGARFAWLEVVAVKRSARSPGAGLYELRNGAYEYVGGHRAVCTCGGVRARVADCPMCGTTTEAPTT